METDYGAWRFWFDVAQSAFMLAVSIWAWQANKHRATKSTINRIEGQFENDIKGLDSRLDEHRDRLTTVELELSHVPGPKDIGEIHYRVDQIGQGVKSLKGELKQINNTM
ncbi:MAG TPA: hypothetical protein EYP07_02680, partial [Kiloniellaceae bacterium]|nr:hypothetical protein [Kiloniellaceae bacterium]